MSPDTDLTVRACGRTHVGHVRSRNEDALLTDADRQLYVVCDGLGGHPAGDVASRTATDVIDERLSAETLAGASDHLTELAGALHAANHEIIDRQRQDTSLRGMGTTAVVAVVRPDERLARLAHVGDSRAYLLTPDRLCRITRDHVWSGVFGRTLSQALGTETKVDPEPAEVTLEAGSRLLLCTDGLTDMLEDREIEEVLRGGDGARDTCEQLVDGALERGGVDNVTVIVVAVS